MVLSNISFFFPWFPNSVWEPSFPKLCFGFHETEFPERAFPNGVWEREELILLFQHRFADDFLDGGHPAEKGPEAGLAERFHALLAAVLAQLVGRHAGRDQVAKLVVDRDELEDAGAAAVAGVVAALAAPPIVKLLAFDFVGAKIQLHEHFGRGLELGAAVVADLAHQ